MERPLSKSISYSINSVNELSFISFQILLRRIGMSTHVPRHEIFHRLLVLLKCMPKRKEPQYQFYVTHTTINVLFSQQFTPGLVSVQFVQHPIKRSGTYRIPNLLVMQESPASIQPFKYMEYRSVILRVELTDNKCTQNTILKPTRSTFV